MPSLIDEPARIAAAGNKSKLIEEYIGHVSSGTDAVSIARMTSPGGWTEPAQTPEFDEYSVVLAGMLRVTHGGGTIEVRQGQAVIARAGEWVQYSTPEPEGRRVRGRLPPRLLAPDRTPRELRHQLRRSRRGRSRAIASAALRPGAPITPPPGWVPEPHR